MFVPYVVGDVVRQMLRASLTLILPRADNLKTLLDARMIASSQEIQLSLEIFQHFLQDLIPPVPGKLR